MKHDYQSQTKVKEDVLLERLALIQTELAHAEASKMKQLSDKLMSGEQHFLFSGHFSAGKSSLINALFETNLLPSSPIPASANTVRIRSGQSGASVHFINGKKMIFKAPYDIDQVKGYCLNGEEVERVELSAPSKIEKDVIFIDTPGIDSTDEAHRLSTESSMYLADVVFYVMDYNHVQSEVNYQFIRELYRQNKKIILIVNQIDKHNEAEISFKSFKKSVVESFETWGMSLESFFFISLRDLNHPQNQFHQLKTYIEGLSKKTPEDKVKRVYDAAIELIENIDTVDEDNEVIQAYEEMETKLSFSKERIKLIEEEFQSEASTIQKSAILMPYEVREAGRAYLESLQSGFKVGLIFRDKKTQQERSIRYEAFVSGLEEQVKSQLEWHFKELLQELKSTAALTKVDPPVLDDSFHVDFTVIQEEAKKGNGATGEAVLHYTENVAYSMKTQIKQQAEKRKNLLIDQVNVEHNQIAMDVQKAFETQVGEKDSEVFLAKMELVSEKANGLWAILEGSRDEEARRIANSEDRQEERQQVIIVESIEKTNNEIHSENEGSLVEEVVKKNDDDLPTSETTVQALQNIATELTDLPGFDHTKQNLIKKASKLADQSYTVALFGAFSAGKSSFANALIGEKILPSSPNPTTATLNRICPVTTEHAHKTAMIHYKTEEELLEDLNHSLSYFGEQAFSLRDSLQIISAGKLFKRESAETKPHALFLRAVVKGEGELSYLGMDREVTITEYEHMIVNESKAAFIASISLYYDCPLTREGITLVDTPGADSINARHTGVAFQYMKAADAILYVTYYNHAFSKADREFLIQLGRVKDVFEMDKMFFLLNASDLAENDGELRTVLDHVNKQLQQYGIRYPSLYPVSSLAGMLSSETLSEDDEAFLSKLPKQLRNKGGLASFEERFYRFIRTDLSKMAVEASLSEITRIREEIAHWIEHFELNANEKEEQLKRLYLQSDEAIEEVEQYAVSNSLQQIEQELTELVHYVPQRLFYRFNDFFKEAFNPSIIQSRDGLNAASRSLLEDIEQDLLQELRAASLRIDRFIKRELQKNEKDMQMTIRNHLTDFRYVSNESRDMATPAFSASLTTWISSEALVKLARSSFKSSKQFFEQNGRDNLHDVLKKEFQQPVSDYLATEQQVIASMATNFYEENLDEMKHEIQNEIREYIETRTTMLNSNLSKGFLQTKQSNVARIQTNLLGE